MSTGSIMITIMGRTITIIMGITIITPTTGMITATATDQQLGMPIFLGPR